MSESLRREIDELTAAAKDFHAQHQPIADLAYPAGVRIAVNVTVDFDAMLLRRLMNETPMQLAKGEFGGRVGIWRLLELFEQHRIKATIFTPGRICELYPRAVQAAARAGHEIGDHMWEHRVPDDRELERDHLMRATAALEILTGKRPVGTRSWHRQKLLIELGYIYNSHGNAYHNPYYVRAAPDEQPLLNLPFHYAIDDAMFFSFAWLGSGNSAQRITDPDRVFELWWNAFFQQYRAGGTLNVVMHPFVSGRALRIAMLDRLFARMQTLPGVWFCTCEEMARHCLRVAPAAEA